MGLTSIQARLAQCFYLLSESRINHCWSLFGTTARLALAIGLNRRRRVEVFPDYVEEESRKRVFWCAYSLDNYLSAALGRPRIFHDEDIDQVCLTVCSDSRKSADHPSRDFRHVSTIPRSPRAQYFRPNPKAKVLCSPLYTTQSMKLSSILLSLLLIKYPQTLPHNQWNSERSLRDTTKAPRCPNGNRPAI